VVSFKHIAQRTTLLLKKLETGAFSVINITTFFKIHRIFTVFIWIKLFQKYDFTSRNIPDWEKQLWLFFLKVTIYLGKAYESALNHQVW